MDELIARARQISSTGTPHRVAVAAAHDDAVIDAVIGARSEGIAEAVLIGDAKKIIALIEERGGKPGDFVVIATESDDETAVKVAETIGGGKADIILKGIIPTSKLLKKVLDPKYDLRRKGLLSHAAVLSPKRYPKLLTVTDGGMVIPSASAVLRLTVKSMSVGSSSGRSSGFVPLRMRST